MFGSEKRKLETELMAGRMCMTLGLVNPNQSPEEFVNGVATGIHSAAQKMVRKGKRDDAMAMIQAERRDVPEQNGELWVQILDSVSEQL